MLGAVETAEAFQVAGDRWRDGLLDSRLDAVQDAVGAILDIQFPELDGELLARMGASISIALLSDAQSAARVNQLLGESTG